MKNVSKIEKIKNLPDGTIQYSIVPKDDSDIRKEIFAEFAKARVTIFELKKSEATLEDAFINLIDKQKVSEEKVKKDDKKAKNEKKEKGGDK